MQGPETLQLHVKNSIGFLKISQALNTFKVKACEKTHFHQQTLDSFKMLQSYQSVSCWLICQRVPFWPKQCCTVCNFAGPCKEYAEQTVVDGQDKVNKLRLCKDSHCDVHVWHVWHTCPLSEMKWDSWPVCPSHGISHYLDLFSHACVSRILWSNSTGALRK